MQLTKLYESVEKSFDYDHLVHDMWRNKILAAKRKFKIDFDTENDESEDSRNIDIRPDGTADGPIIKFKCQLHLAGGDWQTPIVYFRCQIIEGYVSSLDTLECFCVIPGLAGGNPHLIRTEDGLSAPDHDSRSTQADQEKAWKYLTAYLHQLTLAG